MADKTPAEIQREKDLAELKRVNPDALPEKPPKKD